MVGSFCVWSLFSFTVLSVPSSFENNLIEDETRCCFLNCILAVMWLLLFCVSSSWYSGLVCNVKLWHFLVILAYFFMRTFKADNQTACNWRLVQDFVFV